MVALYFYKVFVARVNLEESFSVMRSDEFIAFCDDEERRREASRDEIYWIYMIQIELGLS